MINIKIPLTMRSSNKYTCNNFKDWDVATLKEISLEYLSGGTPSTKEPELWNGNIHWTTSAPISGEDLYLYSGQRFISEKGLQKSASHLLPKGNLLIGTRVGVGKAVVNLIDIAISQDLTGIILDLSKVIPDFIAYQFKIEIVQALLNSYKRGTTIKGISRFDLESVKLFIPPIPEQKAIVKILRAVQDAKDARQQEIVLERERKAALMKYLFTYGTRGEQRKQTEIGEIPQSWQLVKIDELFYLQQGKSLSPKSKQGISPYPFLRASNVLWGKLDLSTVDYMDFTQEECDKLALNCDDLLVCEGGETGRTAIWNGEVDVCYLQNHIHRLRKRKENIIPLFYMFWMQYAYLLLNLYAGEANKTTIPNLSGARLKAFIIPYPSLSEQDNIAKTLQSCDAKISALEREEDLLDELFRAMLESLMISRQTSIPVPESSF